MASVFGTSLSTGRVDLTSFAKKTDLNAALNAIASNITRVHDEQKNKHTNLQKAYVDLQKKASTLKEKVERDDQRVRGETGPKGEKGEKGERGEKGEKGDEGERGQRGESTVGWLFRSKYSFEDDLYSHPWFNLSMFNNITRSGKDFSVGNSTGIVGPDGSEYTFHQYNSWQNVPKLPAKDADGIYFLKQSNTPAHTPRTDFNYRRLIT